MEKSHLTVYAITGPPAPPGGPVNRPQHTRTQVAALFALPFNDLLFQAATVHRQHFDPNAVQLSQLLSIKTGACPEDCSYCPQSARFQTGLKRERLMAVETVLEAAKAARDGGATRYCMGAAWRSPRDKDVDQLVEMVKGSGFWGWKPA